MKHQFVFTALALCIAIAASGQTPAYHANVLGIQDGRTNIQLEIPISLNRWGQVIGTYGGGQSGGTHAVLWTPASANDGTSAGSFFSIESSPGLPTGTADTGPYGLNDRGQLTGWAYTPRTGRRQSTPVLDVETNHPQQHQGRSPWKQWIGRGFSAGIDFRLRIGG